MKKILLIIFLLLGYPAYAEVIYKVDGGGTTVSLIEWNTTTGTKTTLIDSYAWGENGYTTGGQFFNEYEKKIYIKHPTGNVSIIDVAERTVSKVSGAGSSLLFPGLWGGDDVISTGTDAEDGSSTTILGSLDISDSNGNTLIENKADGSVHIGENSLVTQEVNGVQQLYATNSAGNQIDLNIKSGTNLLIGGRNIMDIIGGDISGSVALSSALAALPNSSPDAFYTCGLGTGIHDSSSALSAGCASDFSNYAFVDKMPKIFQTASFNIGSSFLINGEPDISEARDMSIKAGITFKFGSVKPIRAADRNNHMLENKIDAVMAKNDTIQAENDLLKAQIAEINTQLKALNMVAMN